MGVSKQVLGMNARNFLYIQTHNPVKAKKLADNKIRTKRMLLRNNLPTANLIAVFTSRQSVRNFQWEQLPHSGFAIKPARGFGGQGILVFRKWSKDQGETLSGQVYTKKDLESHIYDLLDGSYSLGYLPDVAFIEERIIPDSFFRKLAPIGLPDIRLIVFNKVPVMAMLRLPTKKSDGKANVHQGALAVGVDIRTGITVFGVLQNKPIIFIPDTKIKVRGIKIPEWDKILLLAAKAQAASGLGYAGVDIVVDKNKGPLVLEINARPGLAIQIANRDSLRTRLERLESVEVPTPERGVEIAKSLFAESIPQPIQITPKVLSVIEPVIFEINGVKKSVEAKLDTGAYRTSLDVELAKSLGLNPLAKKILVKAASGLQKRSVVKVKFWLGNKLIETLATIAQRSHLRYPLIIGRKDLKGFLVDPNIRSYQEDQSQEDDTE